MGPRSVSVTFSLSQISNWHCIKDKPLGWSQGQLWNPRLMTRPQHTHTVTHSLPAADPPPLLPKHIHLVLPNPLYVFIAFEKQATYSWTNA